MLSDRKEYRLLASAGVIDEKILDVFSKSQARFFCGGDTTIRAFFTTGERTPVSFDVSGWATCSIYVKALGAGGVAPSPSAPALVSALGQVFACDYEDYLAGISPGHVSFEISGEAFSIAPGNYWVAFWVVSTNGTTFCPAAGRVTFVQDGVGTDTVEPGPPATDAVDFSRIVNFPASVTLGGPKGDDGISTTLTLIPGVFLAPGDTSTPTIEEESGSTPENRIYRVNTKQGERGLPGDNSGTGGSTVPDATTTTKGISRLATTAEATAGTSSVLAVTPAGLSAALSAAGTGVGGPVPDASTTAKGIIQIATEEQALAGISLTTAVTPAGLKSALDAAGTGSGGGATNLDAPIFLKNLAMKISSFVTSAPSGESANLVDVIVFGDFRWLPIGSKFRIKDTSEDSELTNNGHSEAIEITLVSAYKVGSPSFVPWNTSTQLEFYVPETNSLPYFVAGNLIKLVKLGCTCEGGTSGGGNQGDGDDEYYDGSSGGSCVNNEINGPLCCERADGYVMCMSKGIVDIQGDLSVIYNSNYFSVTNNFGFNIIQDASNDFIISSSTSFPYRQTTNEWTARNIDSGTVTNGTMDNYWSQAFHDSAGSNWDILLALYYPGNYDNSAIIYIELKIRKVGNSDKVFLTGKMRKMWQ